MPPEPRRRKRSRGGCIGRWLGAIMLALALLLALALTAVFAFEQATLRPLAEHLVESATGRVFSIEGELDASPGRIVTLEAGDIRLANADWGQPQPMLRLERIRVSIDLLRVIGGTPAADSLEIDGAQLLFESDAQGRSNWAMGTAQPEATTPAQTQGEQASLRAIPVLRSQLRAIEVSVIDPALTTPLDLHFASIEHHADHDDRLLATIDGRVRDRPFEIGAEIQPVSQLLAAGAVRVDLEARSRSVELTLNGEVDSLAAPGQASAHLSLAVADIAQVLATLGLPEYASGPADIRASLLPVDGQHTLDLHTVLDVVQLDAQARLQALDSIDGVAATLSASGPDIAALARLAGLEGLPPQAFSLDSSVALSGTRFTLQQARFDSGSLRLEAQGVMAQFPTLEDSNLQLQLSGANYVELVDLFELADTATWQAEPFDLRAKLEYDASRRQLFSAELVLADLEGKFQGELMAFPTLVGSALDFRVSGRNDALLQQWIGRPVQIEGGYTLAGKLLRSDTGVDIERTDLGFGTNRLQLSGKVGNAPLVADTALTMRFQGPDIQRIVALAGYDGFLPEGDADISVDATLQDQAAQVDRLQARLGHSKLQASGRVNLQDALDGSTIELSVAGKDIADVVPQAFRGFIDTGQAFDLSGKLATANGKLAIERLQAKLGELGLQASGSLSAMQPLADTALKFNLEGPDLAALVPAGLVPYDFPAEPFAVAGGIALATGGLVLDGVEAQVGENRLAASGTVPLDTPTEGLALSISASGPNLAAMIPLDKAQADFTELSYEVAANLALRDGLLTIEELEFSTPRGKLAGGFSVTLDDPRSSGRFDLRASGDNLDEFAPSTPEYQPAAVAFNLDARGGWDTKTLNVERGTLRLGGARIEASGRVSLPPEAISSELILSARGDSMADLGQVKGLVFPPQAFSLDAGIQAAANRLQIPELVVKIGESDLSGSLKLELGQKPEVDIRIESRLLNLEPLLPASDEPEQDEATPQTAASDGRVIPDLAIPVEQLNAVNLVADIDIGELRMKLNDLHDIELDATLHDGHLEVERLKATATQGQLDAQFEVITQGERIATRGKLEGIDIVLGKAEAEAAPISLPKQDLHLGFDTEGATLRELAGNLHGFAQVTGGAGRLQNSRALALFGSFFSELLGAINPFVKQEPYTTISCYAAYAEIVDGVAEIKPGAVMQTDKLDMYARGQIDLNTERINLRFDTSARQGIGISVADFVNPFVGVSGTLANPGLGVDPENAMFEGGFAYATGGLSIVAKSLWRRWFGAKDPCVRLQQEAQEYQQEKQEAAKEAAAEGQESSPATE